MIDEYDMLPIYKNELEQLRMELLNWAGIKPKISHEDCGFYAEIKGHKMCMYDKEGKFIKDCSSVTKTYPKFTNERLLKLIAATSQYFQVHFEFERGIEDVEKTLIRDILAYEDIQGGLKRDVADIYHN